MEENQKSAINLTVEQTIFTVDDNLSFSKAECVFAYIMLAVGFCFMRFVVFNVTGIITTIFFWGLAFLCLLYIKKNEYKLNKYHIVQFGLILVFSLVFSITANDFIKFLNIIFLLMAGVYWVYSICLGNEEVEHYFFFSLLRAIFILPFASFGVALKAIVYSPRKSKSGNNIKLVLLGLVITIPLTLMVAELLKSADKGVEDLLNALYGNLIGLNIETIIQFVIGIPVAFYIFGMLYSNTNKVDKAVLTDTLCEDKLEKVKLFPNIVMYSAVTPICILYIIFFVSQLRYFISAFTGILPEAFSYAEYARRGFFELSLIAIINLLTLLFINLFSKQTGETKPVLLKVYSILISAFTIMIIATALSKMIMYISNYGLTQLRVYTSWFMLLLIVVFILIIIKQLKFKFNFAKYAVVTFVIFFGVLCFSNVDGNISKFNIKMYQAGYLKELDVQALCILSDDALVYVLKEGIDTQGYLEGKLDGYDNYPYLTYNLSSLKVKRLLEDR